jgi:hypothetical protein
MKALLNVIDTRLLRRPGWLRAASAPAILVSDSGFAVHGLSVPWDAVSRIKARRGAASSGPLGGGICLEIGADLDLDTITLSEGQRGFDDFVAMADRKMTFPLGWWDHLDGPATRRQGTLLFERFTHG